MDSESQHSNHHDNRMHTGNVDVGIPTAVPIIEPSISTVGTRISIGNDQEERLRSRSITFEEGSVQRDELPRQISSSSTAGRGEETAVDEFGFNTSLPLGDQLDLIDVTRMDLDEALQSPRLHEDLSRSVSPSRSISASGAESSLPQRRGLVPPDSSERSSWETLMRMQAAASFKNSSSQTLIHTGIGPPEEDFEETKQPHLLSMADMLQKAQSKGVYLPIFQEQDSQLVGNRDNREPQLENTFTIDAQNALQAAEHGNATILAKYLQDEGDPMTRSRLHHMGWTLLHLAAGCSTMGGSTGAYRRRPEPDTQDGYATCVSLLLAAGADPNCRSKQGNITPLMGACLNGSTESARLLLQAGADPLTESDDGETAEDGALKSKFTTEKEAIIKLLHAPPRLLPRSPLQVSCKVVHPAQEEGSHDGVVEIRWRVPSQASIALSDHKVGEVLKYVIKCWTNNQVVDVIHTTSGTGQRNSQRRDFCKNTVVDRGIALRQHLALAPPQTASAVIHNLAPGIHYSFTVSCIAEVDGTLSESPPSCMSKVVQIPTAEKEDRWMLGMMNSNGNAREPNPPIRGPSLQNLKTITPPPKPAKRSTSKEDKPPKIVGTVVEGTQIEPTPLEVIEAKQVVKDDNHYRNLKEFDASLQWQRLKNSNLKHTDVDGDCIVC